MNSLLNHLRGNFSQWIALGILVLAMFTASRGAALPAIWALARFVLPLLVIWLVFRLIKARVSRAVQKFQEQMMQGMNPQGGRAAGNGRQVLDLCPKCGSLMAPNHRCK